MERDTFIFRKKWYEAIKALDNDTKAQVFDTICEYALYHHTDIPTAPMVQMAMAFITPELVDDFLYYEKVKAARSEAGKKHKGNQYTKAEQNGTNGTSVPSVPTNGTNGTSAEQNGTNGSDYVSSMTMTNNSFLFLPTTREMPKEKKEEFIFEIGKKILLRGFKKPISEAKAFFNHNQSTGWVDGKGRRIQDASAWVDGWQCNAENYVAAIETSAREFINFINSAKIKQPDVLEGFRGMETTETEVILIMTKKAHDAFEDCVNEEVLKAKNLYFEGRKLTYRVTR